jgi:large subunit ribosomal protein L7/L12
VEAVFQKILQLDLVEVHLLTELVNERMGVIVSDAQRSALANEASGNNGSGRADTKPDTATTAQEKTQFELKLVSFDEKAKIKVIKEVRAITGLGLKESKDLVESLPKVIKKDIKKEEAETLKQKLVESGAVIEIV